MSTRLLAVANEKGGVGKTATVLGLSSAIASQGGRVLVVDMDPQGNATTGLGVTPEQAAEASTYDLMAKTEKGSAQAAIRPTGWSNVDLIAATKDLSTIQADGSNDLIFRLDIAFEGVDLSPYDAVFVDCPPTLGKLLFAPLCAADGVIVVAEPTVDGVSGVVDLEETVDNVRRRPNPRLVFEKIIISRKRNTGEHISREADLREDYGDLVARTCVPELAARQDAHSSRMPMHSFTGGKSLTLQVAYNDLLAELNLLGARQ